MTVTESSVQVRDRFYIGGEWVEPSGTGTIEVINSTTEEVMGRIPEGTAEDVDRAVRGGARGVRRRWSQTPVDRARRVVRADLAGAGRADGGDRRADRPGGRDADPARAHDPGRAADDGLRLDGRRRSSEIEWEQEVGNSLIVREPVGVVGAITPWNYPLHQIAAKVAPALAAGCTVVVKPSEVAPLNAFLLADILDELGLPAGVFNLVTGYGPVVGEALAAHPGVDMISFTGSTRAGRRVSEVASAHGQAGGAGARRQVAERDPRRRRPPGGDHRRRGQVLPELRPDVQRADPDARPARAARRGRADRRRGGAVLHARRSVRRRDEARPARLRRPARARPRLHRAGRRRRARSSSTGGAEAPEGLERGYFVAPTVFSEVTPEMTIAREEIFGPVLVIMPYDDEDDAVRIANDTDYGLAGGVWSGDEERAKRVARRIRTGQVEINGGAFNPLAPFGGFKQSGHGRELGRFGLEEFLAVKSLQLAASESAAGEEPRAGSPRSIRSTCSWVTPRRAARERRPGSRAGSASSARSARAGRAGTSR